MNDIKKRVEAILFASGRKMNIEEISKLCRVKDIDMIKNSLKELKQEYEQRQSPLIIMGEGDVWNLTVGERYLPLVQNIVTETELSKTIMETLAVIAWKQPILQSEVIKIRTNKAYDHIHQLEDMGFLISKRHGRTKELKLTENFFKYFDLAGEKDIREFFKDVKAKHEQRQREEEERRKAEEEEKAREEPKPEAITQPVEGDTTEKEIKKEVESPASKLEETEKGEQTTPKEKVKELVEAAEKEAEKEEPEEEKGER